MLKLNSSLNKDIKNKKNKNKKNHIFKNDFNKYLEKQYKTFLW